MCFKEGKPPERQLLAGPGIDKERLVEVGDSTTVRGLKNVGRSPPCAQYEQLVLVAELDALIDVLESVETEHDVKNVQAQFASMKAPLLDLIAKCKRAACDLIAARKASGRLAGKRDNKGAGSSTVNLWPIWSLEPGHPGCEHC